MLMETDCSRIYTEGAKGAVIDCDQAIFFIAAGIGKLELEGNMIMVLSPLAPMGRMLAGKKAGDGLLFNNKAINIRSVW